MTPWKHHDFNEIVSGFLAILFGEGSIENNRNDNILFSIQINNIYMKNKNNRNEYRRVSQSLLLCTVLSRPDTLRHWYQGTSCSLSGGLVPHKDFSFLFFILMIYSILNWRSQFYLYNIIEEISMLSILKNSWVISHERRNDK